MRMALASPRGRAVALPRGAFPERAADGPPAWPRKDPSGAP